MKVFEYFLIGMKEMLSYDIARNALILIAFFILLIAYRRLSITMKSGGGFWSSYKISDGFFYIHSGIVPGNRKILLKDIDEVTIHLLRGRNMSGKRYHIELSMKEGRHKAFMIGKSRKAVAEIDAMKRQLKKNRVKLHYYDYTKV